jgi:hypothetical protein
VGELLFLTIKLSGKTTDKTHDRKKNFENEANTKIKIIENI